jgi:thymidine kinase
MFGGKTAWLIAQADRYTRTGVPVQAYKHPLDMERWGGESDLRSHTGVDGVYRTFPCLAFDNPWDVYDHVQKTNPLVVLWDELQFYTDENNTAKDEWLKRSLVTILKQLAAERRKVFVAGLDLNFRGEVFGPMGDVLAHADRVEKSYAVCDDCGSTKARLTQRTIEGKPARYRDHLIVVGGKEPDGKERAYQARCRGCHEVENMPTFEQVSQELRTREKDFY